MHELSTPDISGLAPTVAQLAVVAETEHLTHAAERLGIPQPTLSRSMARLSDWLGVAVLVPEGRGVRLTRAGRLLAEHAGRAAVELAAGVDAVRREISPVDGRVVLGFLHSMGPVVVPQLVRSFRAAHPELRIDLVQDGSDRITEAVLSGEVDVGLASPPTRQSGLRRRDLARQDLVLLVPADHRWAARSTRSRVSLAGLNGLAGEAVITLRPGFGVRTLTDDVLRRAGVAPRYAFEADDLTTVAGLVAAGLGVAVLPQGTGDPATTRELRLDDPAAVRTIAAIWADRAVTEPAAALRHHLVEFGPAAFGRTSPLRRPSSRPGRPGGAGEPTETAAQPAASQSPSPDSNRSTSDSSV